MAGVALAGALSISAIGQANLDSSYDVNVMVIKYFPMTERNRVVDPAFDPGSISGLVAWRASARDQVAALESGLEQSGRYHGYSNPGAPSALRYSIVSDEEYISPVPTRFSGTLDRQVVDFERILSDRDICAQVDSNGVNEVWILLAHPTRSAPDAYF